MMLEALIGDEKESHIFDAFKVKKVFKPAIMIVIISIFSPKVSMMGHLAGVISALILWITGIHFLSLPGQSIKSQTNESI